MYQDLMRNRIGLVREQKDPPKHADVWVVAFQAKPSDVCLTEECSQRLLESVLYVQRVKWIFLIFLLIAHLPGNMGQLRVDVTTAEAF